jgi:prepilin-type processing-associated H-X9-DG protein
MRRAALTLVETLIVIAILATLIGLLIPAVMKARASASAARCRDMLRQVGVAAHGYQAAHSALPPGVSYKAGRAAEPYMSWLTRLLPHVEQDALWQQAVAAFRQSRDFSTDVHRPILATKVAAFLCPADPNNEPTAFVDMTVAFTNVLGCNGVDQYLRDGLLFVDSRTRLGDIPDGASNTVLAGERPVSPAAVYFGWWYAGIGQDRDGSAEFLLGAREEKVHATFNYCKFVNSRFVPGRPDNHCDLLHFWSHHPGGAHFLFADGAVRFLPYSADDLLPALATRAGGEAVTPP